MSSAHTSRLALLMTTTVLAIAVWMPTTASAASTRYASPGGTGDCSAARPCDFVTAVTGAVAGDDVIVTPGDYSVAPTVQTPAQIDIHGVEGQPRPKITFTGAASYGLYALNGSTVRWLEIRQTAASTGLLLNGATADQVKVIGRGAIGSVLYALDSTMRNSLVVASDPGASAIMIRKYSGDTTVALHNVTAVATGTNGIGVELRAESSGYGVAKLHNVIAKGGPGGSSLYIHADANTKASLTAVHSNFASYLTSGAGIAQFVPGGGNQAAAPAFVNAAGGDYRQAPGSATVGAGLASPGNGGADLDGDPRSIGTVDIGADELVLAPAGLTGPASAVTHESAVLNGSLNPKGAPTSYRFEYGTTTAYGSSTAAAGAGTGTEEVPAAATVAGLKPETTYHFRLVAVNAGGEKAGADGTFTTAPAPSAASPARFAGVALVSRRLSTRGRLLTVKLSCPAGTVGRCTGRTKLTAKRVTIGRARFSIAPGAQAKVKVRVSRAGRRLLRGTRRVRGRDVNAARDGAGRSKTTSAAVTIRRR